MARTLLSRALTHINHTQGPTWSSQVPHTNESIICHRPSSRTVSLLPRTQAVPFIRLTSRGHQHPAELHHSRTLMPRHTIGNPRHGTPDLRRPVSITPVSQTPPLLGARYEKSLITTRYHKCQVKRQILNSVENTW